MISIYYYFGWIRAAYFNDEAPISQETASRVDGGGMTLRVAIALLAAASIILGFYQGPFGSLLSR